MEVAIVKGSYHEYFIVVLMMSDIGRKGSTSRVDEIHGAGHGGRWWLLIDVKG